MTVVDTTAGSVRGSDHEGGLRFAGIPYAAPPVGDLRFAAPRPHPGWDGVRDALEFGPAAPQQASLIEGFMGSDGGELSEDCLTLSVFTPAADDCARPVMVWIHGGGFILGTGSSPLYDAGRLVDRGDVVVVTINYRLGAYGFLHLAHLDESLASSGLNGILDQVAALEWVSANIAAFGGDPGRVTIFGESAGAMSVSTLLAMPDARGLFHAAIAQSGAGHNAVSADVATERGRRFCELAGCETIEGLRALDDATIMELQGKLMIELVDDIMGVSSEFWLGLPFVPVVEGRALSSRPIDVAEAGASSPVPLLSGTTAEEFRLFSFLTSPPDSDEALIERLQPIFGPAAAEVVATYRKRLVDAPTKEVFDAALTDAVFRAPMARLAEAHARAGNPTWVYRFDYATPAFGGVLGACHALELPFLFDRRDGMLGMFAGLDSPDSLVRAVQGSWLAFARHGDPNHPDIPDWRAGGRGRPTMIFDADCVERLDPDGDELDAWASVV